MSPDPITCKIRFVYEAYLAGNSVSTLNRKIEQATHVRVIKDNVV